MCGEGELVGGVHTLVLRSVQVDHELQDLEEEEEERKVVQEIARESQVEEKRSDDHEHGDGVKDSNILSRSACADDVTLTRPNEKTLCALRSCGCQWKWSVVYASCSATQSLMFSLASASCFVTKP